jgi:hypothetical protein
MPKKVSWILSLRCTIHPGGMSLAAQTFPTCPGNLRAAFSHFSPGRRNDLVKRSTTGGYPGAKATMPKKDLLPLAKNVPLNSKVINHDSQNTFSLRVMDQRQRGSFRIRKTI